MRSGEGRGNATQGVLKQVRELENKEQAARKGPGNYLDNNDQNARRRLDNLRTRSKTFERDGRV